MLLRGDSNEYPQSMVWVKKERKNVMYTMYTQVHAVLVGVRGMYFIDIFPDVIQPGSFLKFRCMCKCEISIQSKVTKRHLMLY